MSIAARFPLSSIRRAPCVGVTFHQLLRIADRVLSVFEDKLGDVVALDATCAPRRSGHCDGGLRSPLAVSGSLYGTWNGRHDLVHA